MAKELIFDWGIQGQQARSLFPSFDFGLCMLVIFIFLLDYQYLRSLLYPVLPLASPDLQNIFSKSFSLTAAVHGQYVLRQYQWDRQINPFPVKNCRKVANCPQTSPQVTNLFHCSALQTPGYPHSNGTLKPHNTLQIQRLN